MVNDPMNTTLKSYESIIDALSLNFLAFSNSGPAQFTIVFGVISTCCAISLMVTILLSKVLWNKTYVLYVGIALGDSIMCVATLSIGIRRIVSYNQQRPVVVDQYRCLLEDSCRLFAAGIVQGFFFSAAVDRLLAVAKPLWYKLNYPRWLFCAIIIANFVQAGFISYYLFLGANHQTLIPVCAFYMATTPEILTKITIYSLIFTASIAFVQLATIATVYVRLSNVKKRGGNISQAKQDMQIRVMWTLTIMLAGYLTTYAAAALCFHYFLTISAEFMLKHSIVVNIMDMLNPIFNFSILIWKNKDFRSTFLNLMNFSRHKRVRPTS